MLQVQKDARHKRLRGQIDMIQQELAQLTMVEVEQRERKLDVQVVSACLPYQNGQFVTHIITYL